MASTALPDDALMHELRARVLRQLLTLYSVGAVAVGGLFLLQARLGGYAGLRLYVIVGLAQLVVVLRLAEPRLGYRRAALLLLAFLWSQAAALQLFRGLTPGTALSYAALLVLAGVFFGRRGAVSAFWVSLLTSLAGGGALALSLVTPAHPEFWDPLQPLVWLRLGVVFVCFGGALALVVVEMVGTLHRHARELLATLERERAERTQREAAQLALERANRLEAMGQLAGGMAHDFNNSLTVILSGLELLQADTQNPMATRKLAGELADVADTAAAGVRQLLTLGRQEGAKPVSVRARDLLERCKPAIDRLLPARMKLDVQLGSSAEVSVDPSRLTQALLNLALNARDAMSEGGRLSLSVDECERDQIPPGWAAAPGRFVRITCSDTGSGMSPTTQHRIFEPFFTTKAPGQGTGLGLSMVRAAVHDANGFIEVESRIGRGSHFRIYLPMLPKVAAPRELARAARL